MNVSIAWKYAQKQKPCFHIYVPFGENLERAREIYGAWLSWTNNSYFCLRCGNKTD